MLLSHPLNPSIIEHIIQGKNHSKPLDFKSTRSELIQFEKVASKNKQLSAPPDLGNSEHIKRIYTEQGWTGISLARNGGFGASGGTTGKKKSSTRKYICPVCGTPFPWRCFARPLAA